MELGKGGGIAGDAEVGVVPSQHPPEPELLLRDRVVPPLLHLHPEFLELADHAGSLRFQLHHEASASGRSTVEREAQKVESLRTPYPPALPICASKPAKLDKSRLSLMKR